MNLCEELESLKSQRNIFEGNFSEKRVGSLHFNVWWDVYWMVLAMHYI